MNEKNMNKDTILHKWLNGTATADETEQLKASEAYASYLKIAKTASKMETPLPNSSENYAQIASKIKETQKVREINPYRLLLKIAAIFVFIVGGYMYLNSLDTTVVTQVAQKQNVVLPDNSEVILNSNSSLSYNKGKWAEQRILQLEGEAYFSVKKGKKFKVQTPEGIVSTRNSI